MQDMLVPILGENGAIIAQYVITLAVILALIALIVWAIRRYGGGGARPAQRARLPRLAVVDALAIDNKRKLVLVRRDNVEHLVLIGGPTDVVVEPSIVRQRVAQRPGQATTAIARAQTPAAPQPPPPPPPAPTPQASSAPASAISRAASNRVPSGEIPAADATIPFPPQRGPAHAGGRFGLLRRETARAATALAPEPVLEPTPPRRPLAPLDEEEQDVAEVAPQAERTVPPLRAVEPDPVEEPVPGYAPESDEPQESVSVFAPPNADRRAAATGAIEVDGPPETPDVPAAPPTAAMEPPVGAARPAEVSDLEKEMARLLDEISTTRRD